MKTNKEPLPFFLWMTVSLILFFILPHILTGYLLNFIILTFMFTILAQSWDIIGGLTGYVSFHIAGFFGIGAYGTGVLMSKLGWPFFPSLLGGIFLAAFFSILVGPILLRLSGHYFVVASFALSELIREIISNLTGITGGGMGLALPIYTGTAQMRVAFFYYLMGGAVAFSIAMKIAIHKSYLALTFKAIRETEVGAKVAGVNTTLYKTISFTLSSILAGLAGGIYAYWVTYLEPVPIVDLHFSITAMIMTLIGGAGSIIGPIIGTVILNVVKEVVWNYSLELHSALLGLILVITVLFLPKGLIELGKKKYSSPGSGS
jgi:branched-chain amino acid transport system permease protein